METAYLHLVTNHIPIIGVPFAIALLAFGLWRRSGELVSAAFIAFVGLGVATIGVYFLGQGGEDFIEELPGVSHDAIEDHEKVASFALLSVLFTAIPSAFALVRFRFLKRNPEEVAGGFPRWITLSTLVLALGSAAVLGYTGRLGGKIRHTEFHGATGATTDEGGDGQDESDEGGRRRGRNRGGR